MVWGKFLPFPISVKARRIRFPYVFVRNYIGTHLCLVRNVKCLFCSFHRLTFYVNAQGHFQLFVDNEYKGALLSGLPVKDRMWLLLDLYGVTVSAKFIALCKT